MASVLFSVRQQGDDALLRHALEIEVDLGDLQSALFEAESGQRGYLLTGKSEYLVPYHRSSNRLDQLLDRLGTAVRDVPNQAATYREICGLVERKRSELAQALSLRMGTDESGAASMVESKPDVVLMDQLRERILRMDREQDRLVIERQGAMQRVGLATSATTAISLVLMGLVSLAALAEVRKRARLARFLPGEVASRLADDDRGLRGGRIGPATVVFIDIRGFTALTESLEPADVSTLLTTFRQNVSAEAQRHGGMVDKFIGDGALVVFGALDGDEGAAGAALAFAEDLLARLAPAPGRQTAFQAGIGVHHGEVFCGIVGSADRQEFTVLGDTVNVASRIEAATRSFATDLLVSEAVLAAAGANRDDWRTVSDDPLRGRREPVVLYAPSSRTVAKTPEQ